ncbi:hypothetical protein FRC16_008778 [Serendipita sp. 398]|nr:hypothetical protein FRC16_008778 [Serendipita sp. 398]
MDFIARTDSPLPMRGDIQNYNLPPVVQTAIASWIKNANALAIIMTLFAAVQISLIQLLPSNNGGEGENSAANALWRSTRWFMYAGILFHLGGASSSVAVVHMAVHLPQTGREIALNQPDSLASRAFFDPGGGHIPLELLRESMEESLLSHWGLGRSWRFSTWHMILCFFLGLISAFLSIILWVWASEGGGAILGASIIPVALIAGSTAHRVLTG